DISRSAFYKYKDAITPFQDLKRGRIITFHITLRDKMGVLSSVLSVFANTGANILTINQSIPINGTALVTISAETTEMTISSEELLDDLHKTQGVKKVEVIAG
ncbi:MAG: ACT domain-containing protein, partial [Clostridiales bacterium]|nr:ACT domain-containing protein [Clostridiales bacterium]